MYHTARTLQECIREMVEEGGTVWYVLSQSQSEYKKLSDTLISKYKTLHAGNRPANSANKWELLVPVMRSMYKVVQANKHTDHHVSECPPCDANPFKLICIWGCPMFNQAGICSHTLTIGHVLLESLPAAERPSVCNVRYMCRSIDTDEDALTGGKHAPKKALEPHQPKKRGIYATRVSARKNGAGKKTSPKKKTSPRKTIAKKPAAKKPAAKPAAPKKKKPAETAPISQTKPTRACSKRGGYNIVSPDSASEYSDSD